MLHWCWHWRCTAHHFIRSISRNFRKIGKIRVGGCLLALASTSPVRNPGFATVVCFQQLSIQASINILGVFSIFGHLTNISHNNDRCCLRVTLPRNFGKWQRPTNGTLSFYGVMVGILKPYLMRYNLFEFFAFIGGGDAKALLSHLTTRPRATLYNFRNI